MPDDEKDRVEKAYGTNYRRLKGLAKTIRAMADGSLDSQIGARICNALGIMRTCLETTSPGADRGSA
jgi:hypothetical protein